MDDASGTAERRRHRVGVALGWLACAASAGCTALLGDFSNSTTTGTDAGGTLDGQAEPSDVETPDAKTTADATMNSDAALDAETASDAADGSSDGAPPGPLACKTWLLASPVVLEVLSLGNRSASDPVVVIPLPSGRVRVIAGKSSGIPFSVYTVDPSQTPPVVVRLDAPAATGAVFGTARRSGSSIQPYTAIGFFTKPIGGLGSFYAYTLPDTMLQNGPLPADFQAYATTAALPAASAIRFEPFSTTDLFTIVTYPTQTTPTNYVLGVGRATTAAPAVLTTAATSPNADDFFSPIMLHANSNVYIFDENDHSTPGLSTWTVPDTGVVTTTPAKRAISGGQPAFLHDIVGNSAMAAADIAYQGGIVGTTGGSINYRAGTIADANLDTWVSTDLPLVKSYTDPTVAPVFPSGLGADSRWSNDNMMILGPGNRAADGGAGASGLNMLWFDATGALRGEEDGANALMSDRNDFTAATAAALAVGATSARWAVVWVETKSDDAGTYDTILYNELDCH